jgi:hypothetical protein
MIGIGVNIRPKFFGSGAAPLDPDATAFITAAGITDATQQSAINTLVVDLKTYGIWTKMKAIYPFVGGTATTHKWNLKDARDLDAAFRLVFSGGWTHSSNGATPNGTNGIANTFIVPNTLSQFSTHLSYYSRTNNDGPYFEMGFGPATSRIVMGIKSSGTAFYDQNNNTNGRITFSMASTNSTGLFLTSRTANNLQKAYRNSGQIGSTNTNTITSSLPSNGQIRIGAFTDNVLFIYSNRECAFSSIGSGLTDTEAANLYTAVQAYQTTLSRNV